MRYGWNETGTINVLIVGSLRGRESASTGG